MLDGCTFCWKLICVRIVPMDIIIFMNICGTNVASTVFKYT